MPPTEHVQPCSRCVIVLSRDKSVLRSMGDSCSSLGVQDQTGPFIDNGAESVGQLLSAEHLLYFMLCQRSALML